MSNGFPDSVDVWRMVNASRIFEGTLAVAKLPRLCASLAEATGQLECRMEFDRNEFSVSYIHLTVRGRLPLTCQRTLEVFDWPIAVDTRLGLIRREEDEAALPPGFEALLVTNDGILNPADVIEDEVILALPLVPRKPGASESEDWEFTSAANDAELLDAESKADEKPNPFAALAQLKPKSKT